MAEPSAAADGGNGASLPQPPSRSSTALAGFQQADVLKVDRIPLLGPDDMSSWHATPDGVVILSQTCDVVQPKKQTIQVAPLRRLPAQQSGQARKGAMPSYVPVPSAGLDMYADLEYVATVYKSQVSLLTPMRGVGNTDEGKKFGMRVGRRYSRFPFPDNVTYWLSPLKDAVIKRADKPNSSLGKVFGLVESLRLESDPNWESGEPYSLKLLVVIDPGNLPMFDEEEVIAPPLELRMQTHNQNGEVRMTPAEVADELLRPQRWEDRHARAWLWDTFAESLARICRPGPGAPPEALTAVADGAFDSEVTTTEEITYNRVLRSEEIDVEHLSPPLPR
jgi:hypothetical protein